MQLSGFPDRYMGAEVEFFTAGRLGDRRGYQVTRDVLGGSDIWHPNGGRSYLDVENLMEICTPEVMSGWEVVAYDRALEAGLMDRARELMTTAGQGVTLEILRSNHRTPDDGVVFCGFHENYLISLTLKSVEVAHHLAPFWATRQIIGGAGSVVAKPFGAWQFQLAQRSRTTSQMASTSVTSDRGFIRYKNDVMAPMPRYRRLEVIGGDTNILAEPEALMFDITSLMLLMLENAALPDIRFVLAADVLHETATAGVRARLTTADGAMATPVSIQHQYAEAAQQFIDRHDLEKYQPAVAAWVELLDHLAAGRFDQANGRIDWVTKWLQLETAGGSALSAVSASEIERRYHCLVGGDDTPYRLRSQFDPPTVAPAARAAAQHPPPGRACLRARVHSLAQRYQVPVYMLWDSVTISASIPLPPNKRRFDMADPYRLPVAKVPEFEALLKQVRVA